MPLDLFTATEAVQGVFSELKPAVSGCVIAFRIRVCAHDGSLPGPEKNLKRWDANFDRRLVRQQRGFRGSTLYSIR